MEEKKTKKTKKASKIAREEIRVVPEYKKKLVKELAEEMKKSKTILIASTKGLPSSQFHLIKKNLRGKADIRVVKKTAAIRAIEATEKGALQNLKAQIKEDVAIFLSDLDAFELSGLLSDSRSPAKARAGEIAPEDIRVEPGPTDLVPGPAISELAGVGLKVAVEGGKLAIKQEVVVAKAGAVINEKVASVLGKLGIMPMKVGFEPIAAYDAVSDKIYIGIRIDKKGILEELRTSIGKALSFAVKIVFPNSETIKYLFGKAALEEKALDKIIESKSAKPAEEKKEEKAEEKKEGKVEEKKEEKVNDTNAKEEAK